MKLLFTILISFSLFACQANRLASNTAPNTTSNVHHGIIKGSKNQVIEICPQLETGQIINFELNSNLPVLFNFHYHKDKEVIYPISERNLITISEQYTADNDNSYCLMWKVHLENTKVKYQYQIL